MDFCKTDARRITLLVLILIITAGCVLHAQQKVKLPGNDWIQLFKAGRSRTACCTARD
jgi:hypothetical protein